MNFITRSLHSRLRSVYQITNKLSIGVRTVPGNTWPWFKLENIKYHDQLLAIQ